MMKSPPKLGRKIQKIYLKRNIETLSSNHCSSGRVTSITQSERMFVALSIQHLMRMRRTILSCVACRSVSYISTLSHKRLHFRKKKVTERKVRVLILSTTFDGNILHSTMNWARYDHKCLRMFIYVYVCVCVYIYIYTCIYISITPRPTATHYSPHRPAALP